MSDTPTTLAIPNASFYPPPVRGIPADLARPNLRYRLLAGLVLLGFFLFLLIYLVFLAGSFALIVVGIAIPVNALSAPSANSGAGVGYALFAGGCLVLFAVLLFVFLFKGFFPRQRERDFDELEITEEKQPELYQFLRRLCEEIRCPMPARICLNSSVNAAVYYPTSILNLLVTPPNTLLIGLGLVNSLNLVEFKAVLAHECGHFSQRSLRLNGYVQLVYHVLYNMVHVRDHWDDLLARWFELPVLSTVAVPLAMLLDIVRLCLNQMFGVFGRTYLGLCRQMEFNADLVAVSAVGSDAPIHVLLRSDFAQTCLQKATEELRLAAEHNFFSQDLFFHQTRAAEFLRNAAQDPQLGCPPAFSAGDAGSESVFSPEHESPAAMWADHPSHYAREQNAKGRYFRSPQDDRPAWLLFRDVASVRQEVTDLFYIGCLHVEPVEPKAPADVEAVLAEERAVLTFDSRKPGIYYNRDLELGDFAGWSFGVAVPNGTPSREQLQAAEKELYPSDLPAWVSAHNRRREELDLLWRIFSNGEKDGTFLFRGKREARDDAETFAVKVQKELEADRQFLMRLDRSVFVHHYHLALSIGKPEEFRQRYEFQLRLQMLLHLAWDQHSRVNSVLQFFSIRRQLRWDEVGGVVGTLTQAREGYEEMISQAGRLNLPALLHLTAGEPLSRYLPKSAPPRFDSSDTALEVGRVRAFSNQVEEVLDKLSRIRCKSLHGILDFQEQLAQEWRGGGQQINGPSDLLPTPQSHEAPHNEP